MKRIKASKLTVLVYGILNLSILAFCLCILSHPYEVKEENGRIDKLPFIGVYQEAGGLTGTFGPETRLNAAEMDGILLRGHFSRKIELNEQVFMYIHKIEVHIRQNGHEIFAYGAPGTYPGIVRSVGTDWGSFRSPGISPADEIEIEIKNAYPSIHSETYNRFFQTMCISDRDTLLHHNMGQHVGQVTAGSLMILIGLVLLLTMGALKLMKVNDVPSGYFACGGLLIIGAVCTIVDYDYITLLFRNAFVVNIADFVSQIFIGLFLLLYLRTFLVHPRLRQVLSGFILFWMGCILFYFVVQVLGILDFIEISNAYAVIASVLIAGALVCLMLEYQRHKKSYIRLIVLSTMLLCIFAVAELINFYTSTLYWIFLFQFGLAIFTVFQLFVIWKSIKENLMQAQRARALENELVNMRISVMLSQIQPHFLYNCLATIKHLCRKDSQLAEKAVVDFSAFLRGNMTSLECEQPLAFDLELRHIKTYLSLEKMRFGDRLNVEYQIGTTAFILPALTLQPIVENAVRHGITKREEGGTVTITTADEPEWVVLTVTDDGLGFDPAEPKRDGRPHLGLENARKRIELQCGGTLELQSRKGVGTTVTIRIPKTEQKKPGAPD